MFDKSRLVQEIITKGAKGCNLSCAELKNACLIGINLRGAKLIGAELISARLIGANLRGADLENADLGNADLSRIKLRDANLRGGVVEKAQLGANLGLTEEMKLGVNRRGAIFEDFPNERSWFLSRR